MRASDQAARTVYIITGPVRSGKTTFLMARLNGKKDVAGFLTPDYNGIRNLYDISTRETFGFEKTGGDVPGEECVGVGRFCFYREGFEKGKQILAEALIRNPSLLVIDEIGRLELNNEGFGPMVHEVLNAHQTNTFQGDVLLVVRDTLMEKVITQFGIMEYRTFSISDLSLLEQIKI
jgi:nucleoside-triphosphatase THEP1